MCTQKYTLKFVHNAQRNAVIFIHNLFVKMLINFVENSII